MSNDNKKKSTNNIAELDPQERELFLNAFYQDDSSVETEDLKSEGADIKPAKKDNSNIDFHERELFLNSVNQGAIPLQKVEYDSTAKKNPSVGRLKKKRQVDQRIDLHGMYAKDAVSALLRFIHHEKSRGTKTLLVIHGKGGGILKNAVWSIIETHPDIDDFQQASGRHGGDGAIIIRINQKKRP